MFGRGAMQRELAEMKQRILINDSMHMETVRALGRGEEIAALRQRIEKLEAYVFVKPIADAAAKVAAIQSQDMHA